MYILAHITLSNKDENLFGTEMITVWGRYVKALHVRYMT
jgi:hypothetical protein